MYSFDNYILQNNSLLLFFMGINLCTRLSIKIFFLPISMVQLLYATWFLLIVYLPVFIPKIVNPNPVVNYYQIRISR